MKPILTVMLALLIATSTQAKDYVYQDFQKLSSSLYHHQPDIKSCNAGSLHEHEKSKVLSAVNEVRSLHGLPHVIYNESEQGEVMQTAMLMAANGKIDHYPPSSWKCWDQNSAKVAGASLLSGGVVAQKIKFFTPGEDIAMWLADHESISPSGIGHRRWLLDPFLKQISYGRVSGEANNGNQTVASILKIMRPERSSPVEVSSELITYPSGDYPSRLYMPGAPLSVSLLIDKNQKASNDLVDFSKTQIKITSSNGRLLKVNKVLADNNFFGLPNNLQFNTSDLIGGERYDVTLDNVIVRGEPKSYKYWFKLSN